MLDAASPARTQALAAGPRAPPAGAVNAFRVFFVSIDHLRNAPGTPVEPVESGWCYVEERGRGFEIMEVFEPTQAPAEWMRHWFGDSHPVAAAVAATLSPSFGPEVDYELRFLQVPPLLPPSLWIASDVPGSQWILTTASNLEGIVPGRWYDFDSFIESLRAEAGRLNWELEP